MSSFSSLNNMIGCERKLLLSKHFRKYIKKSDALMFGTIYHESIEFGIAKGIQMLEENGMIEKKPLLIEMLARLESFLITNDINVYLHEQYFEIDIDGTEEKFLGYIDGVARYMGEDWLVEFKSAIVADTTTVHLDAQVTSYLYACSKTSIGTKMSVFDESGKPSTQIFDPVKINPVGVIYIINEKKMNKKVRLLKNGSISTAKNQGCSYADYKQAIIDKYETLDDAPEKVIEHLVWLEDNEPAPKLKVVFTRRSKQTLDNFGKRINGLVHQEFALKKKYYTEGLLVALEHADYFCTKFGCNMCDYKVACVDLEQNKSKLESEDLDGEYFEGLSEENE